VQTRYLITYGNDQEFWTCLADGNDHAIEQFKNAFPNKLIVEVSECTRITYDFTVVWGDIGDDHSKRVDYVTVNDPSFEAIMDEAFKIVHRERCSSTERFCSAPEQPWDVLRNKTPYDGYAIFEGHIPKSDKSIFV
jgi:hypothetical protein